MGRDRILPGRDETRNWAQKNLIFVKFSRQKDALRDKFENFEVLKSRDETGRDSISRLAEKFLVSDFSTHP